MKGDFFDALRAGAERVAVWADLLDRINVFPVADGDTGRNLLISLLPLKSSERDRSALIEKLFLSARGNSGNIAAQFFTGFLSCENEAKFPKLHDAVHRGTKQAWQAVANPRPGTILSVFDDLESSLKHVPMDDQGEWVSVVLKKLEGTVLKTARILPVLQNANVVDAGALGIFIFFDAFLHALYLRGPQFAPLSATFKEHLSVREAWEADVETGSCVDAVVRLKEGGKKVMEDLSLSGNSVVARENGDCIKIHIHTGDQSAIRDALSRGGSIIQWASDDLSAQTRAFSFRPLHQAVHIMTDAAGSITRDNARHLGMTVLDSYIAIGTKDLPETYVDTADMYTAMAQGIRVTTSQASVFERYQHYEKILGLYNTALYLCVGSVYTGNYHAVMDWKSAHDPEDRLKVIDTGAASGKLGLIAIATAEHAATTTTAKEVSDFALHAVAACEEYIFLDTLHFLAMGGRLSKTSAVFGDMLHLKPVVSPAPEGAKKVAVLRNRKDQVAFAMEKLENTIHSDAHPIIMIEYTDNKEWTESGIAATVRKSFPYAEIILQPFSLTTGAHTGPGTWGIAFLPSGS